MNFNQWIEQLGARIMTPEDNRTILEFYNSISMSGGHFNLSTKKEPDYFRFLNYVSDIHFVFGVPNQSGALEGMGAVIVRPCYLNGKPDFVGHFLDLRFKKRKERTIAMDWKHFAFAFLNKGVGFTELRGCRYYHGSYMTNNLYAVEAIGKDPLKKPEAPIVGAGSPAPEMAQRTIHHLPPFQISNLATYQAVGIYARKPLKAMGFKGIRGGRMAVHVSRGTPSDLAGLEEFLDRQNRVKAFGYIYSGEASELKRRLRQWDDFSMTSFFIARDLTNRIIGAFAAWDPRKGRQIYVDRLPADKAMIAGVGRAMGMKVPRADSMLDILYLTALEIDHALLPQEKQSVFASLLDELYKSGLPGDYHMVSFCDYKKQSMIEVVRRDYLFDATPVILYQLYIPNCTDVFREELMIHPPGHEMVFM